MGHRLIKNKKQIAAVVACIFVILLSVLINNLFVYVCLALAVLFLFANLYVYKKNAYVATHMFTTIDRNYNYLVIGDDSKIRITLNGKCLYVLSPSNRSQFCVELLIKRLYSLIDEDKGKIIVCVNNPNKAKGISVFDYPFLHENTLRILNVKFAKVKMRLPFLLDFVSSIKVLIGLKSKGNFELIGCPSNDISEYCRTRNIKLEYYKIN